MDKTTGKNEGPSKKIWMPLSSGSFMILSWTATVFAGVLGFKLGAKIFPQAPHEFETGVFTSATIGLIVITISIVAIAQYGFWQIYKRGRN